jgi:hypothetical protein
MLTDMGNHAAPLRLAETPDRITVLAKAMRDFAGRPASPDTQRELDTAMLGCTRDEYETAWAMAQQGEVPAEAPLPDVAGTVPPAAVARPAALTRGQQALAVLAVVLELALAPVFFIVMFVTVNNLLAASFRFWAWTVPVATELTFALLLVLAVLFEWMRRPVPALWKLPYLFAALSAFMNAWAGKGSVAGIAGHLAVTAAFFIPLGFAKTTVRKLIITAAERERAQTLADARAHAYDVLRAAFGPFWRVRTPVLLRRQLRSGRLPAAVMAAVGTCDAAAWEPAVQTWITAGVTLPARVAEALRAASAVRTATPSAEAPEAPAGALPEPVSSETAEPLRRGPARASRTPSATPSRGTSGGTRERGSGQPPVVPSKASDEDLAALIIAKLAKGEEVSQTRTVKIVREAAGGKTGIGPQRAGRVLELARRIHSGEVKSIGKRQTA